MIWETYWQFSEPRRLARYASEDSAKLLPNLASNPTDLRSKTDAQYETTRLIYDALASANIAYALDPVNFQADRQIVRQPAQIFQPPRWATCLDLAVLVGGLCLEFDLLALIILTRGHAFVAVARSQFRTDLKAKRRADGLLFDDGQLPAEGLPKLCELIDRQDYFALECTGVAYTSEPGPMPERQGRFGGRMPYESAVEAGRKQLDLPERPFMFALDLHTLRMKDPAYEIDLPGAPARQQLPKTQEDRPTGGVAERLRRKALQQALDAATEEYEAVSKQRLSALDPSSQVKLDRQANDLLQRMQEIEKQLDAAG